jgi:hypothetical protein
MENYTQLEAENLAIEKSEMKAYYRRTCKLTRDLEPFPWRQRKRKAEAEELKADEEQEAVRGLEADKELEADMVFADRLWIMKSQLIVLLLMV